MSWVEEKQDANRATHGVSRAQRAAISREREWVGRAVDSSGASPGKAQARVGSKLGLLVRIIVVALTLPFTHGIVMARQGVADPRTPLYIWVQLHPDRYPTREGEPVGTGGELLARAVLPEGAPCPTLVVDGAERRMSERVPSRRDEFPVTVCEAPYPGDGLALLAGRRLPGRVESPHRVLLIGDTGCRVDEGRLESGTYQHCNDPQAWPFGALATHLSDLDFDLVIHLGDYHYREVPCPNERTGCAGSPGGDNWPTWRADFFEPAAPLLLSAPWIMLRGNHERCGYAGVGWLHLLQPEVRTETASECRHDTDPYWVELGESSILVLDTASLAAKADASSRATTYRRWMADALGDPVVPNHAWLALHHPLWQWPTRQASDRSAKGTPPYRLAQSSPPALTAISRALVEHARSGSLPAFNAVLSGHLHLHQSIAPEGVSTLPWQITVGNGGASLHPREQFAPLSETVAQRLRVGSDLAGSTGEALPGASTEQGHEPGFDARASFHFGFGYAVLTRQEASGWTMTAYDTDGRAVLECPLGRQSAGHPGIDTGCRLVRTGVAMSSSAGREEVPHRMDAINTLTHER